MHYSNYAPMGSIDGLPLVTVGEAGVQLRIRGLRGSQVALLPAILHRAIATGNLSRAMSVRVEYEIGSRPYESTLRAMAGRLLELRDLIGFCGMVAACEESMAVARTIEQLLSREGERCFFRAFPDESSLQAWLQDTILAPTTRTPRRPAETTP